MFTQHTRWVLDDYETEIIKNSPLQQDPFASPDFSACEPCSIPTCTMNVYPFSVSEPKGISWETVLNYYLKVFPSFQTLPECLSYYDYVVIDGNMFSACLR